ncbi:Gfo/Idh/MocA family protein [Cesiribacter sp. SM1]|uniref:Gfo/Idh/MocA family protein n=1 Tax=Cesiribacter sp. SM1 TaxID=2861196 RepID=UPI001CD71546|nr:Gfo/Idh/MocA family oxidoreductase [Cesiribacter sp. SM1]
MLKQKSIENKIRVGIISENPSKGWSSIAHIPALISLPEYEIRAISNENEEKVAAAQKEFNIPMAFNDNLELIQSPEIDMVVLGEKVPGFRKLVTEAIIADKILYCDWPLGYGFAETIELARFAKAMDVHNAIGLQSRAAPTVNYIKDLISEGYVGKLKSTSMVGACYTDENELAQNLDYINSENFRFRFMCFPFVHAVDVLCYCMGEFRELNATAIESLKPEDCLHTKTSISLTSYDQIAISGVLENGALASVLYSGGVAKNTNFLWEIIGTEGSLHITSHHGNPAFFELSIQGSRGESQEPEVLKVPQKYQLVSMAPASGPAFNVAHNYAILAKDLKENTKHVASFDDAVVRHRMIKAIEVSAATGTRQIYLNN